MANKAERSELEEATAHIQRLVVEWWSGGVVEWWSAGVVECWGGVVEWGEIWDGHYHNHSHYHHHHRRQ